MKIEDLELVSWYPSLGTRDEKAAHKHAKQWHVCGEWFKNEALGELTTFLASIGQCAVVTEEDKALAMSTRRRL
jgi:hypothetical protein